jgi:L-amino acid N-acyltransferase YncA
MMQSRFGKFFSRDAVRADLPEIVDIYNSAVRTHTATADTEPVDAEDRVQWFCAHSPDRRPLWVVVDDRCAIVGWFGMQDLDSRPPYARAAEVSVYLLPSACGQGLGGFLLSRAIEEAPSLGISHLIAEAFGDNRASCALFASRGFEVWGVLPGVVLLDGAEQDLVIYGRRV